MITSEDRDLEAVLKVDVIRLKKKKIKVSSFKRYLSKKEFSFSKKVRIVLILKNHINNFFFSNQYVHIYFILIKTF